METPIPFSQKLYLLAIYPGKGGINSRLYTAIDYGLIGTFLWNFIYTKIRFDNKKFVVTGPKSDVPIHRYMLERKARLSSPRKISTWMGRFYFKMKDIRNAVLNDLTDKRLIRMEPKRFLFF